MTVIGSLYMRSHYVSMARWCNRAALTYLKRASTPLFPTAASLNVAKAASYLDLRDEYMERARGA